MYARTYDALPLQIFTTIVGPIMKLELTEEVHKYKCCVAETLLIKNLSPALSKNEGLDISALIH